VNKERSGATLAYIEVGQFIKDNRVRTILEYLSRRAEDRDNWVFNYEDSKAVHEYVRSLGFDLAKVYEEVFAGNLNDLLAQISKAQIRVDMRDELARNYAKLAKPIEFMGYTVPAVNVPSDFASIVGDILNKDASFAVMYVVTDQKILVSMRSDKVNDVDVQAIAYSLLGGGHRHAAAFSLPHTELPSLLKGKIQPGWL
jgi:nanoRNase/pAp phosphatase (c-di-AMP/oligoRNAs hydrolase)